MPWDDLMKYILFLILGLIFVSCTKEDEQKPLAIETAPVLSASNSLCESKCGTFDQKICDSLFKEYDRCYDKKNESACSGFVLAFSNALPKTVECTNTCSKTPFKMAITYSCDDIDKADYPKITERSSHLLSKLEFKSAVDLFLSDEFHGILDGALAEDLFPEIEKRKKQ